MRRATLVALTTLDSTICDRKKSLTNWADDSRKNWLCAAYTPTQYTTACMLPCNPTFCLGSNIVTAVASESPWIYVW